MLELAILIPSLFWFITESQKVRANNEAQNLSIKELAHSIKDVAASLEHHIKQSELNQAHMADLIEMIWDKSK